MAIGLPASYKRQVNFSCSRENARAAIIYTLEATGWAYEVLGPDSYTAETPFNASSVSETVSVSIINPDIIVVESSCTWFQIFDWGKNRRNVDNFLAICESRCNSRLNSP
jgi:hypothetical protein